MEEGGGCFYINCCFDNKIQSYLFIFPSEDLELSIGQLTSEYLGNEIH